MQHAVFFTQDGIVPPALEMPSREIGAVVEFWGVVRELEHGAPVGGLFYEAYETMAVRQFEKIFEELQREHPISQVQLVHRLGWVPTGEPSLFVRVLSAHRGEAFHFCHRLIDRMKEDVPIWKAGTKPR